MMNDTVIAKNSTSLYEDSQRPVRSVGSIRTEAERVKRQIGFAYFPGGDRQRVYEICMIIAEARLLPPDCTMKIGGEKLPAGLVADVYGELTHEHVELVMDHFKAARYEIKAKKTYIRTALYNVVFEYEHDITNFVSRI